MSEPTTPVFSWTRVESPDVLVLVDWAQADTTDRQWLTDLTVASLGWGSRYGAEFAARVLLPDPTDATLPSGVATYAMPLTKASLPSSLTGLLVVVLGPQTPAMQPLVHAAVQGGARLAARAFGPWMRQAPLATTADALTHVEALIALVHDSIAARTKTPATVVPQITVGFEPPEIAVIIPSHNRSRYIPMAIASVLSQHYPHAQAIVADDGSTDGTPELVAQYAHAGVRLFRKAHSGGPDTRNQVLATVTAPFVVWLGDDDVLTPDCLTSRLAMLARYPQADVIYGEMLICDVDMKPTGAVKTREWHGRSDALIAALFQQNEMTDGGSLVRRESILRAGGYNPAFPKGHDYEFWTRAVAHTVFKRDPQVGYYWRWHGRNMGVGSGANPYQDAHVRIIDGMVRRFTPAQLFPEVPWQTLPPALAEGVAAFKIGARLVREQAWPAALPYAEAAVRGFPGPDSTRLMQEVQSHLATAGHAA